MPVTIP